MIHWLSILAVAIPCFVMAWHFLRVWQDPLSVDGGRWVRLGVGIIAMEFIVAHSGIMLLAMIHQSGWGGLMFGLFVYGALAAGFAVAFRSWVLLRDFLLITTGRLVSVGIFFQQGMDALAAIRSFMSLGLWMLMVFATMFGQFWIPRLGMTKENLRKVDFQAGTQSDGSEMSGLWVESPHLAISAGFAYFLLLGILELAVIGSIVSSWHALEVAQPNRSAAVETIEKIGGKLHGERGKTLTLRFVETKVRDPHLIHLEWLPGLIALDLRGTNLGDAGMAHLHHCSQLSRLNLAGTRVTDAGLNHLKQLEQLVSVDLGGTQVTRVGLNHLAEQPHLEELFLTGCQLTDGDLVPLRRMAHLKTLSLSNVRGISDSGLQQVGELNRLESLYLSKTTIGDDGLAYLGNLQHLRVLDLRDTKISGRGLAHLKNLPALQKLTLVGTDLDDRGLEHLRTLTTLTELDLFRTPVTNSGLTYLSELTGLTQLSLNRCTNLTDNGLSNLQTLTALRRLDLGDTRITDAGLRHLYELDKLTYLVIARTKVTSNGVEEITRALPRCRIRSTY